MSSTNRTSRRDFLRQTAAATGGIFAPNLLLGQQGGVKKLNFAGVGVGGKGESDIGGAAQGANIVAFCDVDRDRLAKALTKYPGAKGFESYKEMFEAMGDQIDGVTVSTPDHAHYPAAMEAIKRGKHVCVQKPLVNRIWEANELHQAAKKKGVKTNMGNQGHTGEGIRLMKEWLNAGIVGNVKEIHVWTNRPIWPQGNEAKSKYTSGQVPANLNWSNWLAQCPEVPFTNGLHPFAWRGHLEYGAGAMGDMGCHLLDGPFWGCELGEAYKLEAEIDELTDASWPKSSYVLAHFKSPKFGEIKLPWYEGTRPDGKPRKPERPAELEATRDWEKIRGGFIIKGDEGTILNTDDYCGSPRVIPEAKFQAWMKDKKPEKSLERSLSPGNPQLELVKAIEQDKICGSNFDYSVPLTRLCLLGNLAILNPGKSIEWNAEGQSTGNADIDKHIKRAAVREGFEYSSGSI